MKHIKLIIFLVLALSIAACSAAQPTAEATQVPTVVADDTIIAEGKLQPIHYTELALNASGLVSEVLFTEGDEVAAGDVIARLDANEGADPRNRPGQSRAGTHRGLSGSARRAIRAR